MTTLQTRLAQADKPTKGPEMTTNNPDPLEVARGHVLKNVQRLYVGGEFHGFGAACACGHCFNGHADEASVMEAWAVHTAAIIAQHYAPVIAENERLRTTGARLLEWWPEGSGNSLAGHNKGSGFADDLEAFRQALGAKP